MKKVLIFSLQYVPLMGGAEVAIREITNRIDADEIEFHMVTLRFDANTTKEEKIGNIYVHRIGPGDRNVSIAETFSARFYLYKILFVPLAAWKGLSLHRALKFEGAWAMMTYMVFPLVLMRFVGVRIPYILTLQEGDPFERVFERWRIRLFAPLLFYGIRHAATIQPISNFLGAWAKKCGYTGPIQIIPNAVDTKRFGAIFAPETVAQMRATLGKKEGDVLLVTTSRLVHKNAIDDVIRALPLLPEYVSFLIYGIGPEEEKLKALAEELSVASRARFMGEISHAEMPLMLASCDVFVRPSRSEGMGNSFIEAMAAGLPVIATQEGGISDFLFDTKRNPDMPATGWAVDADSPEQIAEAVKNITANPTVVSEVTATARAMVIEKYDWNKIAHDMNTLFTNLFR